jgi:hypothetical protein
MEEQVEMEKQTEMDSNPPSKPTKREKLNKKRKIEEYLDETYPLNVHPPNPAAVNIYSNPNPVSATGMSPR